MSDKKMTRNTFYNLPAELQQKIYEYDVTYREKFNKVLND